MTDSPSSDEPFTAQHAELLREVHAHVSAAAAMVDVTGQTAWPTHIATEHRALLARLLAAGALAEDQARTGGVPDRMITLTWLAGHWRLHWPNVKPAALDITLRDRIWAGLQSDIGRLQDMAALHRARAHHLGLTDGAPDPDPHSTEQYTRNSVALERRSRAVADLLELSDDQWASLWSASVDQRRDFTVRYLHPDAAEMVELRWTVYANPTLELTSFVTERAIRSRTTGPELRPRPMPDQALSTSAATDPTTASMSADAGQRSATDAVLPPGTDRSWHVDTGPVEETATDRAAPDTPGTEPW
ncbi:hypothetical protein [Nocardia blacklockiae]|uniref:hypothetical protein n=1 Tax=Nocardia blacklockiae TaxID=480036 RepID=UPI0018946C79|nr:hypothetical protein [Nocardia blacklockiae]MBF6176040.1 hypothetical protein [Nocardia blacklockiae]